MEIYYEWIEYNDENPDFFFYGSPSFPENFEFRKIGYRHPDAERKSVHPKSRQSRSASSGPLFFMRALDFDLIDHIYIQSDYTNLHKGIDGPVVWSNRPYDRTLIEAVCSCFAIGSLRQSKNYFEKNMASYSSPTGWRMAVFNSPRHPTRSSLWVNSSCAGFWMAWASCRKTPLNLLENRVESCDRNALKSMV